VPPEELELEDELEELLLDDELLLELLEFELELEDELLEELELLDDEPQLLTTPPVPPFWLSQV